MNNNRIVSTLLRRNTSAGRIAGFILSNFIGLAIITGALQFWLDARSIWSDEESFLQSDHLVINKKVTSANTFGESSTTFSPDEEQEIAAQPWVRTSAPFSSADYRVYAALNTNGRAMSTSMFFEAIPDDFVDVPSSQWTWQEGSDEIPLIISKDYLTLYNFGFASSAGLPQMSEGLMSGIPITLTLRSNKGDITKEFHGRVAGYSNRLNTILVPKNFMDWSNFHLGGTPGREPSRMIIDVNSPGDTAITEFMKAHDYEIAGDKSATAASFLLKVIIGIVLAIGAIITVLSLFILMLSVSLLMEKNRDKLRSLIMLGYPLKTVGAPYRQIIFWASGVAWIFSVAAVLILRAFYIDPLRGLGAGNGSIVIPIIVGLALTVIIILVNWNAVGKRVRAAFVK